MNDYTEIKGFLEKFTMKLNSFSQKERESYINGGLNTFNQLATIYNNTSKTKVTKIVAHSAPIIMWTCILSTITDSADADPRNKGFAMEYFKDIQKVFAEYTSDTRYFDVSGINREIAVHGYCNITFDIDVVSTFCNTLTVIALFKMFSSSIGSNTVEGMNYIMDFLTKHYLNLTQHKLEIVSLEL